MRVKLFPNLTRRHLMTFRRSLGHTREETGREGVRAHFPISGQKSSLWQPLRSHAFKSTRGWLLVIKNDKARFLQSREGRLENFRVEWIYFLLSSFNSSFHERSFLVPSPPSRNFANGPSLIGVVPSVYIEGVQTSGWRQTRAAKP